MRYFFDLLDGDTQVDLSGTEFENDAAARQEAILRARTCEPKLRLERYDAFRSITVRDETDRIVCKISIDH